jgi:predicted kinase
VILLLNGAFGIGKTTVARVLVSRLPRAVLYDPEWIGIALQRVARLAGREVEDFQDLRVWRRLTIAALRITRLGFRNVIVPMAFSNAAYLQEVRAGIARFEPDQLHVCLVAPVDVVHARLRGRGTDPVRGSWQYRRAAECCALHGQHAFATQVNATGRNVEAIADEILRMAAMSHGTKS